MDFKFFNKRKAYTCYIHHQCFQKRISPLHSSGKNMLHHGKLPEADDIQYPSMLLLTTDHDDYVAPLHSLTFIVTLQYVMDHRWKQSNPLLIHVDTKAGQAARKPLAKVTEEVSNMCAFIVVPKHGLDSVHSPLPPDSCKNTSWVFTPRRNHWAQWIIHMNTIPVLTHCS
uniref:Prolyl endopeptidase n=1 Tax=Molossus molossus TaxID=27622 RepID=A0A7J8HCW4_MOLMO|nr:hypothetical protein HJG59_011144 [Molossus molossus]